jgi:hypothetical protein
MVPSVGRIVHYKLTQQDADQINKRRKDARNKNAAGVTLASQELGAVVHTGNEVRAADVYPSVITRIWGSTDGSAVNGQVLLDGNDLFWATSRLEGEGEGFWSIPPRV